MDFLSWRWLNPITLEAINPQQCNFPSRQDLPGFPPRALCFSLFPPQHTQTQSLSSSASPSFTTTYFSLSLQSFPLCLLLLCLSVYTSFTFFHSPVSHSFVCSSLVFFFRPISPALYPSLAPTNAPSLSYYTSLPATFISPLLPLSPLHVFPSFPHIDHVTLDLYPTIISSQPLCFLLCVPQHSFSSITPHHLSLSYYLTYTHLSSSTLPTFIPLSPPSLHSVPVFSQFVRILQKT